jgi:hypothetical protein
MSFYLRCLYTLLAQGYTQYWGLVFWSIKSLPQWSQHLWSLIALLVCCYLLPYAATSCIVSLAFHQADILATK